MTQGRPEIVGNAVTEGLKLAVVCGQFRRAMLNAPLEVFLEMTQFGFAVMDLLKHLIKGFREEAQFTTAKFLGPNGIVVASRDGLGRPSEFKDRGRDGMLELVGKQESGE